MNSNIIVTETVGFFVRVNMIVTAFVLLSLLSLSFQLLPSFSIPDFGSPCAMWSLNGSSRYFFLSLSLLLLLLLSVLLFSFLFFVPTPAATNAGGGRRHGGAARTVGDTSAHTSAEEQEQNEKPEPFLWLLFCVMQTSVTKDTIQDHHSTNHPSRPSLWMSKPFCRASVEI
mmetsp:Transcript_10910/g.30117  ORF Transcript_10910/g.30117 Transcript_10910/m.30117 type:complete len:171 (-) Transcript_10910:38-550(-)